MSKLALDYDAEVPMDSRAPFSVSVDPAKPPGTHSKDYTPSPAKAARMAAQIKAANKEGNHRPSPHDVSVMVMADAERDYISPEVSEQRRQVSKVRTKSIAKELWAKQTRKRNDYRAAKVLVAEATEEDLFEPSEELVRAQKILNRTKPLTKKKCMAEARARIRKGIEAQN